MGVHIWGVAGWGGGRVDVMCGERPRESIVVSRGV